jgi:hypothetical protein
MGNDLHKLNSRMPVQGGASPSHSRGDNRHRPSTAGPRAQRGVPSAFASAVVPARLGPWVATDTPMDKEVLDVLGPGDFLLRVYQRRDDTQPPVDLFIYSSLTFPPSAPVTPSTRPSTALLELAGCQSRARASGFLCRDMPHFPRTATSFPRANPVSWFSTGIGRTIVEWRVNTGQRSIWLPMPCE